MKTRITRVATIGVLACALAVVAARSNGWKVSGIDLSSLPGGPKAAAPEDRIYAMLDAARNGDVNAFLNSYAGQMKETVRQSITESTPAGFAKYLRDSNVAIKGVAISSPESLSDREVKLRVEYVYADRNEVQSAYLRKDGSSWKIFRVDGAERVKTLVPYGSAATE